MNKLTMFLLAAVAAATVAIGALAAAPSASAATTTTSGFRCHTEMRVEFGKAYLVVVCR